MKLERLFSRQYLATQLLVINGFMIALILALAKFTTSEGMHPVVYAFWQTCIAGLLLLSLSFRKVRAFNRQHYRYFVVSGLTGIAVPNTIAFFLVTKIGSGFTGILYALPPIFTFLISAGLGLTRFRVHKMVGLCVAVLACTWIVILRHESIEQTNISWFLLGLLIPVMLSIGNVFRSVAWPVGSHPMSLAAGTLLTASGILGSYALVIDVPVNHLELPLKVQGLVFLQGCLTAATFLCSFELQKRSDPVFYSQLGSIAAVCGLMIGAMFLDERYSYLTWILVLVLLAGLRVSNLPSLTLYGTLQKILKRFAIRKESNVSERL